MLVRIPCDNYLLFPFGIYSKNPTPTISPHSLTCTDQPPKLDIYMMQKHLVATIL